METEILMQAETESRSERRERGIFERVPGSGDWWIRYHDADGRLRREKAGTLGAARKLYRKRKTEALQGKKLPENLRRSAVPTLKGFSQRFIDEIEVRCKEKPNTISFYAMKLTRLLEFAPLANARLDTIDEALIAAFVQWRSAQPSRAGHNRKKPREAADAKPVSPASINRELATLRRLLRLAQEWRLINRVPRIRLLRGERNRQFVLSHAQERLYLDKAEQPLSDAAMLMLDTGLRVGELLALRWPDVHFEPATGAKFGFIHVQRSKSKAAERNLSLTPRVRTVLESRYASRKSVWVFTDEPGTGPLPVWTLEAQHKRIKESLRLDPDAVIHSFRHTFGTRLGETGADAFTVMRAMGHSTVVVSQKYVHPTPETMERAFERLNAANEKALASLPARVIPALPESKTDTTTDTGALLESRGL
jgi:integrase